MFGVFLLCLIIRTEVNYKKCLDKGYPVKVKNTFRGQRGDAHQEYMYGFINLDSASLDQFEVKDNILCIKFNPFHYLF